MVRAGLHARRSAPMGPVQPRARHKTPIAPQTWHGGARSRQRGANTWWVNARCAGPSLCRYTVIILTQYHCPRPYQASICRQHDPNGQPPLPTVRAWEAHQAQRLTPPPPPVGCCSTPAMQVLVANSASQRRGSVQRCSCTAMKRRHSCTHRRMASAVRSLAPWPPPQWPPTWWEPTRKQVCGLPHILAPCGGPGG